MAKNFERFFVATLVSSVALAGCAGNSSNVRGPGAVPYVRTVNAPSAAGPVRSVAAGPYVFVAINNDRFRGYNLAQPRPLREFMTRSRGNDTNDPLAMGQDSSGDLFVDDALGPREYAPPYTGTPVVIPAGFSSSALGTSVSFDTNQDAFFVASGSLSICPAPYSSCPTSLSSAPYQNFGPTAVAPNGTIFAAVYNVGQNSQEQAYIIKPPYTSAPTIVTLPADSFFELANEIASDAAGNVYVAQGTGLHSSMITEYAPPYTGSPVATITNNVPGFVYQIIFDSKNDMFVSGGTEVQEYAPPYTGAPIATINLSAPTGIGLDKSSNLYVVDSSLGEARIYSPPYTGKPFQIIRYGLANVNPTSLLVIP